MSMGVNNHLTFEIKFVTPIYIWFDTNAVVDDYMYENHTGNKRTNFIGYPQKC